MSTPDERLNDVLEANGFGSYERQNAPSWYGLEELIMALQRFDSLETVIAELKAYDREDGIEELVEYLNDEADYLR